MTVQHSAHIHDQFPCVVHQLGEPPGRDARVMRNKADDPLLHLLKIAQRLRHPQHHAGMAHRVNRHCCSGYNKAAAGGHGQRDADGVAPAQHQRSAGLADPCDQLGQCKAGLDIAADRV